MTLPISRMPLVPKARPLHVGMQGRNPRSELFIRPVNKSYKFPHFIKGIPPKWKLVRRGGNAPPSVKIFSPFSDLKFRLKLRMLDRQRRKIHTK